MKKFFLAICVSLSTFALQSAALCGELPLVLMKAVTENRLVLLHNWSPEATGNVILTCAVVLPPGHSERDLSTLVVYSGSDKLLSFSPQEFPLSVFSSSETGSNLMTVWVSADGSYRLWVFSYSEGEVDQVLSAGSKLMPEFVYPPKSPGSLIVSRKEQSRARPGSWSQRIIISNLEWILDSKSGTRTYEPVTADVYVWDGEAYRVRKGVPWRDRLTKQ
jgi:hypothetical protein